MKSFILLLFLTGCSDRVDDPKVFEQQLLQNERDTFELGVQAGIHGVLVVEQRQILGQPTSKAGSDAWMEEVRRIAYDAAHRTNDYVAHP